MYTFANPETYYNLKELEQESAPSFNDVFRDERSLKNNVLDVIDALKDALTEYDWENGQDLIEFALNNMQDIAKRVTNYCNENAPTDD